MTADAAISNAYEKLLARCTKTDTPLYGGKTSEDALGEASLTIVKRYVNCEDVDEKAVYLEFEKIFLEKCFFAFKKKTSKKNRMIEYIPEYSDGI